MNQQPTSLIKIRDATTSDVPDLLEFLQPFFHQRLILPRSGSELTKLTEHGFAAISDERIVGFAAIEVYSPKLGEIQSLAVASEMQGRGIGKKLVQRCVERARSLGVFELMAITASDKLFRDVGFDYSLPNQKRAFFYQTRPEK